MKVKMLRTPGSDLLNSLGCANRTDLVEGATVDVSYELAGSLEKVGLVAKSVKGVAEPTEIRGVPAAKGDAK